MSTDQHEHNWQHRWRIAGKEMCDGEPVRALVVCTDCGFSDTIEDDPASVNLAAAYAAGAITFADIVGPGPDGPGWRELAGYAPPILVADEQHAWKDEFLANAEDALGDAWKPITGTGRIIGATNATPTGEWQGVTGTHPEPNRPGIRFHPAPIPEGFRLSDYAVHEHVWELSTSGLIYGRTLAPPLGTYERWVCVCGAADWRRIARDGHRIDADEWRRICVVEMDDDDTDVDNFPGEPNHDTIAAKTREAAAHAELTAKVRHALEAEYDRQEALDYDDFGVDMQEMAAAAVDVFFADLRSLPGN